MILEQARNILIAGLLISVVVIVNLVYKTNNPICPDDFNDVYEQAAALDTWLGNFYESNPDATIAEMGEASKNFFVKHNCKEALQRIEDIQSGNADPEIVQMIDDAIPDPPKKVNLIGITVARMTYGRILVRNLTPNTPFSYFIASPDDVIEEDALRYSPTTGNIGDEPIRIIGEMSHQYFWDEPEYFGCVPWVDIEKIEKLPDPPRFQLN